MTKVLASGIDTLVLALDVMWKDSTFFDALTAIKEKARAENKDSPSVMYYRDRKEKWLFSVRPYGIRGYEWFLTSKEFNMRVGNWMEPETRPSVMVEISSEALWRIGPLEMYERVIDLIEDSGGFVKEAKISRADLCVDILLDEKEWDDMKLRKALVCRGRKIGLYLDGDILETFTVALGEIRARLYDKVREIKQMSHKTWMFDIWGIKEKEIEDEKRVIRVEFQIRREVIKELQAGKGMEFFRKLDEVWAYCTTNWLQFKDGEGKEHKLRKTLPWWKQVQEGFYGLQGSKPAIRKKAIRADRKQLKAQILGLASSLTALEMEERELDPLNFKEIENCMNAVIASQRMDGYKLTEFKENVIRKRARLSRALH